MPSKQLFLSRVGDGYAITDVLFGAVNPAGKLPQTFPMRLEDNPAYDNYPGENGRVQYAEGVFVGYRHYEQQQIVPLFAFGFGLSYTSFAYDNLQLSANTISPDEQLTVSIDVSNTGQRAGQEIVQLYVRDEQADVARPQKELKGFAKVELAPGETKTVMLELDRRALAYWDDAQHAWVDEAGTFAVLVGSSSQDIRARAAFELTETASFDRALNEGRTTKEPENRRTREPKNQRTNQFLSFLSSAVPSFPVTPSPRYAMQQGAVRMAAGSRRQALCPA